MARISDKQRKRLADTDKFRHAALELDVECDCGCGRKATSTHEIPAGDARRAKALYEPRAQMYLDHYPRDNKQSCHERIQGMPYAKQIAIVVLSMIRAINRCCGCQAVTVNKVIIALGGQVK